MFLPLSSLGASSFRSAVSSGPPRISSTDYKKLIRLVVPKVKLGSDSFTVKKQCLALVKSHKLNVSAEECAGVASSMCSGDARTIYLMFFLRILYRRSGIRWIKGCLKFLL